MPERSKLWSATLLLLAGTAIALAGCATTEPPPSAAPVVVPPVTKVIAKPPVNPHALAEEARALLAQAETDIQRARARRALWARAWEALVGARGALAVSDHGTAAMQARRASELAQLGLEQVAYPPVR